MPVRRPGSAVGLQAGENAGGPMRPPFLLNVKFKLYPWASLILL